MISVSDNVRPSMALEMRANAGQADQAELTPENLWALIQQGPAWSVRLDGRLVALVGYTEIWPGRLILWGYLGGDCRKALPYMTKRIRKGVEELLLEKDRIEVYAGVSHAEGNRWLKILGFRFEGTMRKFYSGIDYNLYARVS